jgi:hypothetical protein
MVATRTTRLLILGGSLLVSLCCWLDVPRILRGTSRHHAGWQWRYFETPRAPVGVAVALASFALTAWVLQRLGRKRWFLAAAALSAATLVLQLVIVGLTRGPRGQPWPPLIRDGEGSIYFRQIDRWRDLRPLFRDWPLHREELPVPHFPYHPPFSVLPAWVGQHVCDTEPKLCTRLAQATRTRRTVRRAELAASPLITALLVFAAAAATPMLTAAMLKARSDRNPILGAAACAAIPALLTHVLTLDQLQVPLFAAAALLAQTLSPPVAGLLGGAFVGLASQISFVSLALGNVVAALVCLRARDRPRPTLVLSAAMVAAGALLVLVAAEVLTGFSWIEGLFSILLGGHPEEKLQRYYVPGLWRNVFDVLVWCGPLAVVGLAAGGASALRGLWRREPTVDDLPLAVIAGLAVLYVSGAIRAEAGRIWMPYFPLVVMAALPTIRRLLPGRWLWLGAFAQLAHTWVVLSRWGP